MGINLNVTEIYVASNGSVLEKTGDSLFHAQSNYANLLLLYLEDGVETGSSTFINFTPENRTAYTSHWFFMKYQGIVEKIITGETESRSFACFAIKVPKIVLANNNKHTATKNEVTYLQNFGSRYLGFFSTLNALETEWTLTAPPTISGYDNLGDQYATELNVAYVLEEANKGYYQVVLNGETYEWELVESISQYLESKQYNVGEIFVQKGFSNPQGATPISTVAHDYFMTILNDLTVDLENLDTLVNNNVDRLIVVENDIEDIEEREVISNGRLDDLEEFQEDVISGNQVVKKAEQDKNGNDIVDTYETKTGATTKVTNHNESETAHAFIQNRIDNINLHEEEIDQRLDDLEGDVEVAQEDIIDLETFKEDKSNKATDFTTVNDTLYPSVKAVNDQLDLKVSKVTTIIGLDLQDNILLGEFKTALGNATTVLAGLMSASDKQNLDDLVALLATDDGDSVVNTIGEILAIFNSYPEGADLVTALAGKVDKVAGKALSTNDLTDTLKNYYDTAYAHSQETGNPHGTKFSELNEKPTTIEGFGITDAYDKDYIDALQDNNGWEQTDLTPTALTNGQTLVTATLQGYDEVRFICRNLTTGEIDTDVVVGQQLTTGTKIVFFDDVDVYFLVGATNSTFTEDDAFELKVFGVTMTQQLAENVGVMHSGTNYLDEVDNVKEAQVTLDSQIKDTNDIKSDKIETREVGEYQIYFTNGKLTSVISDNVNTYLSYDTNGNIQKITETYADGKSYETTYTKDVEGRIKTMTKAEV